ncbi:MAG: tetratricopeptide repeat protein [Gallionellaceae bacterium]|nr:tetratricopeptide repeat protein [Gallionellaceae bacterium]
MTSLKMLRLSKMWKFLLRCVAIGFACASLGVNAAEQKPIFVKAFPAPEVDEAQVKVEKDALEKRKNPVVPEKLLNDADALLGQSKPIDAYKLLEPFDLEYAGNVRFDYLLGIAALDSGKPDKATLAFERVLAVDPNFAGARLDMARAYFQLGDLVRSKTEFDAVMKQDPPPAARATIAKYLEAIVTIERAKRTRYSAYVESSFGRDSNVNNSTSQSQIPVPAFGNLIFTLSPTSMKTPGSYYTVVAGGEASHTLPASWGVYGGLDLRRRGNEQAVSAFDASNVDSRAGVSFIWGESTFRMGTSFSQFNIAHAKNRDAFGLTGDWRRNLNANSQVNMFMQHSRNRFADTASQLNNFDQNVAGTGYLYNFEGIKTSVFSSLNWSSERAMYDRADGNKVGYGLRIGAQKTLNGSMEVFSNVGYQIGNYDKQNVAFLAARNDKQYDVTLGGAWHPNKAWTVRSQASYSKNNSSILIYSFDRLDASITVRRDFR